MDMSRTIDKCWASEVDYSYTNTEYPPTQIPGSTFPLPFLIPDDD
jgi:hypothetical protein